ncbi:hypothetical protein H310_08771 [Aphanomyces invadans]|uniref:Uncharacterized protein n=1 Tax=Aphanomyces invadans TaxID=157072 RepID=A0A024TYF3_9STRA|nr:hypothetical protein H310_08771 [Aphanomyces invadans]ETV98666.1 hypothetical protein H310_08771 [Aphanomyces invadans]|eukprot:XP_008872863.1 hypothetical protein H310_08771 [Aphanomyces invadans]
MFGCAQVHPSCITSINTGGSENPPSQCKERSTYVCRIRRSLMLGFAAILALICPHAKAIDDVRAPVPYMPRHRPGTSSVSTSRRVGCRSDCAPITSGANSPPSALSCTCANDHPHVLWLLAPWKEPARRGC